MTISQSAAIAAGLAIDRNVSVQQVEYAALRERLIAARQILVPQANQKSQSK